MCMAVTRRVPSARATLRPAYESLAFLSHSALSLFPAIEMHRDIHRAHAEQEPAAHMRKRGEAFAVEKPHSGENRRPYEQHGDHIPRQRMSLLRGQIEHRPIVKPKRFSHETLRPALERLAGQDRLTRQVDRSRLRS